VSALQRAQRRAAISRRSPRAPSVTVTNGSSPVKSLDQLRASRDLGHLAGANVQRGRAAKGNQLLHLSDERARCHDSPIIDIHGRPRLQRGLSSTRSDYRPTTSLAT